MMSYRLHIVVDAGGPPHQCDFSRGDLAEAKQGNSHAAHTLFRLRQAVVLDMQAAVALQAACQVGFLLTCPAGVVPPMPRMSTALTFALGAPFNPLPSIHLRMLVVAA